MNPAKPLSIVALLLMLLAGQLSAQTSQTDDDITTSAIAQPAIVARLFPAIVAGSSALWVGMGQAMAGQPQVNCAWTSTSGNSVTDSRVAASFNTESGDLWVVWTKGSGGTCAAPTADALVYAYISLDSAVGIRCLFAQPQCILGTTKAAGAAGANKLPGVTETSLPAFIRSIFNNQRVNIAATDILPADAKFATYSALAACGLLGKGSQFAGLGYGPGPIGTRISSYYSNKSVGVVDFNIFGNDPINTDQPIPSYTVIPIGAAPELVVVNTSNHNGFGSSAVNGINRAILGLYFGGIFGRTADLLPQPFAGASESYFPTTALLPGPLSGEYQIFEHSIANNKEIYRPQEYGNCGAAGTYTVQSNPLNLSRTIGSTNSFRRRVIGTGEMVSTLQTVQDSIGYALWSSGNFNRTSNIKYLTVDGIDPILDTYTNGTVPQSGNGLLRRVTLSHVKDGTYPVWSMLRLVSYDAGTPAAATMALAAQLLDHFGSDTTHPDFVPLLQLRAFHAHYAPSFVNFNAGNVASDGQLVCGLLSVPEAGGDVGGMVFSLQAGADYCVLQGNYGNSKTGVGPTNTSPFGVRQ